VGMHAVLGITGRLDASAEKGLRGLFGGHEGLRVDQVLVDLGWEYLLLGRCRRRSCGRLGTRRGAAFSVPQVNRLTLDDDLQIEPLQWMRRRLAIVVSWREPWNVGKSDRVVGGRTGAGRLVEWDGEGRCRM
jgi:hypothetical protein